MSSYHHFRLKVTEELLTITYIENMIDASMTQSIKLQKFTSRYNKKQPIDITRHKIISHTKHHHDPN